MKKKQEKWCLCESRMPPAATVKIGYFSVKVTVKVTRSLTLVLFDRVLLVEYARQVWSLGLSREYVLRIPSVS